jgi:hypothetical protein
LIVEGSDFRERLEDVETLNNLALRGALDVSKVSCHALGSSAMSTVSCVPARLWAGVAGLRLRGIIPGWMN